MAGIDEIFRGEIKFVAGSATPSRIPNYNLPEIAFVGKSNVGKSSLVNMICRRKKLARTSNSPGHTRQINFFSVSNKLILVDLPGYGFAKVSEREKQKWETLITYYLRESPNLRLVNLLIDSRRGIKSNDIEVLKILKSFNREIQIVFTKSDKIKDKDNLLKELESCLENLELSCNIIFSSGKSGDGIKELQFSILKSAKDKKEKNENYE